MSGQGLTEVLAEHRDYDVSGGTATGSKWYCRCGATGALRGGRDDARDDYSKHVTAAVTAWLMERLAGVREGVARAIAQMEPGEEWPSNESLGGGPTGTRDDEYRAAMKDDADAALAVVREALGVNVHEHEWEPAPRRLCDPAGSEMCRCGAKRVNDEGDA